jgi:hypothetical protein
MCPLNCILYADGSGLFAIIHEFPMNYVGRVMGKVDVLEQFP